MAKTTIWIELSTDITQQHCDMIWMSIDCGARFGAIYSASKTKEYLLRNSKIDNRPWL